MYTIISVQWIVKKPIEWVYEKVAVMPVGFVAATLALNNMVKGDNVLICGVCNGDSLVTIAKKLALQIGATVHHSTYNRNLFPNFSSG